MALARRAAVGGVGGDEADERDRAGVGEQQRELGDAARVLGAVRRG